MLALVILTQIAACSSSEQKVLTVGEAQIEIIVNPTIDLFSLIHQFAGDNQYNEGLLPSYKTEIEQYFSHLKDHPSIEHAKEFKEKYQINGDAPMALAVYIGPPPELHPRIDLSDLPAAFDPRWDSTLISDYLINARLFAEESNYMKFHASQTEFQESAIAKLEEMICKEQIFQWFYDFFGYFPENFKMYLALLNGSCNYGYPVFYQDGELEFVSVIAARFPDNNGVPTYPRDWYLPIIIHEYTHSFINPLIRSKPKEFQDIGEAMLATHRAKMIERGYDVWNVIIQEYIVRACTIRYIEKYESMRKARKMIKYDIERGFPEIEGLVRLFDNYEENRNSYPDIESFLPEIMKYFNDLYLSPGSA